MTKKICIETVLGKICACESENPDYPGIYIYLEREDGVEIDLIAVEANDISDCIKAFVWKDTSTDEFTNSHIWTKNELDIEE